uniref:Nad2_a n=1 Tax=Laurentiella strenua TaxID=114681 RepID=A0A2I4PER3_9SPIT|nr:nad2_a [Laurentiella strenua]
MNLCKLTYSLLISAEIFILFYFIFIFTIIFYLLPSLKNIINYSKFKNTSSFDYLTGNDLQNFFLTPIFLILILIFAWTAPLSFFWFGNLIISSFQIKIVYLVLIFFFIIIMVFSSIFYFSNQDIFDFFIVIVNFLIWTVLLFFANNLFTVIFIIEILSTLLFLMIITSSFSSTYFYNNLNLNIHNYFNNSTPLFFTQAILFFFWISLLASLNLFFSLILFYLKFLTFDWYLFENIFFYIISSSSLKDIFFLSFLWYNLLFCIFLKCGLVPFYFWKPTFFKGLSLHSLFFYICFFYFFLILFFLTFLVFFFNEIFFFYATVNLGIILIGFFFLLFILCEAYYLKTFLAISSILNTLFIFLPLNSFSFFDLLFIL